MVSHVRRRRARHTLTLAIVLGAPIAVASATPACTRNADIVDERDSALIPTATVTADAEIPLLDAGLSTDAFPACADRPLGACKGPNDFPCGVVDWVRNVARECQKQTGCVTNGWLTVKMNAEGCVSDIGMDQPNDPIVSCLLGELGGFSCPCAATEVAFQFGEGNTGICPDGG